MNSDTIIEELRTEHGILNISLPCPCACDANSETGNPVQNCPYCLGEGRIQYGIDEVTFL